MDDEAARGGRRATRDAADVQAGAADRPGDSSAVEQSAIRPAAALTAAGCGHGYDSRQRAAPLAGGFELSAAVDVGGGGQPGQIEARGVIALRQRDLHSFVLLPLVAD